MSALGIKSPVAFNVILNRPLTTASGLASTPAAPFSAILVQNVPSAGVLPVLPPLASMRYQVSPP
jgi:hypothetical protein